VSRMGWALRETHHFANCWWVSLRSTHPTHNGASLTQPSGGFFVLTPMTKTRPQRGCELRPWKGRVAFHSRA